MGWTSIEQYRSRIGSHDSCFITSERTILEHYLCDVVFKYVLLTNVETSGWSMQNVERSEILVHTNDILQ